MTVCRMTAGRVTPGRGGGVPDRRRGLRVVLAVVFVASLLLNLDAIYSPHAAVEPPFAHADTVAHVLLFAVPAASGLLAGLRGAVVVPLLLLDAVGSEVVQGLLLPDRTGDVLDLAADVAGVALGWAFARAVRVDGRVPARW